MSTVNINLQAKDLTASGGQGVVDPTPDTLVQRTSTGAIKATDATTDNEVVNKQQFDTGLGGKLNIITNTGFYAYTHNGAGQNQMQITDGRTGSTLMRRNGSGQTEVGTPTSDYQAANKKYVDDAIVTATVLTSPNGTKYKITVGDDGVLTTTVTT